jgi:hypothetical protein
MLYMYSIIGGLDRAHLVVGRAGLGLSPRVVPAGFEGKAVGLRVRRKAMVRFRVRDSPRPGLGVADAYPRATTLVLRLQ